MLYYSVNVCADSQTSCSRTGYCLLSKKPCTTLCWRKSDTSGFWSIELSFEDYFGFLFLIKWLCESTCKSIGSSCDNSEMIVLVILPVLAANADITITCMSSTELLLRFQHAKGPTINEPSPTIPVLKVHHFLVYEWSGLDYLLCHTGQILPESFWCYQKAFCMSRDSVTTYYSIYPAILQLSHLKLHPFSTENELLLILSKNPWMAKIFH